MSHQYDCCHYTYVCQSSILITLAIAITKTPYNINQRFGHPAPSSVFFQRQKQDQRNTQAPIASSVSRSLAMYFRNFCPPPQRIYMQKQQQEPHESEIKHSTAARELPGNQRKHKNTQTKTEISQTKFRSQNSRARRSDFFVIPRVGAVPSSAATFSRLLPRHGCNRTQTRLVGRGQGGRSGNDRSNQKQVVWNPTLPSARDVRWKRFKKWKNLRITTRSMHSTMPHPALQSTTLARATTCHRLTTAKAKAALGSLSPSARLLPPPRRTRTVCWSTAACKESFPRGQA